MNKSHSGADAVILKQHLPAYLRSIGHEPRMQKGWIDLKACCPLHDDTNPSLTAKKKENVWEWYCHACAVGGTVIELHALRCKLNPKTQFPVICREVAEIINCSPSTASVIDQPIAPPAKMNTPPIPNDEIAKLTLSWRETLYRDTTLRNRFATELGLPANILEWAANRGAQGLAIAPAGFELTKSDGGKRILREPRLVYIGDGYYKIRAPFGDGQEPRFWMSGKPQRPWLSEWLVHDQTTVRHVHIHESETSALALIAAGAWTHDNSSIVVSTSGSRGFKPEWVPLFTGRTVHMWPDADEPGMRFANETAGMLYGVASQIFVHDWHPDSKFQHHE